MGWLLLVVAVVVVAAVLVGVLARGRRHDGVDSFRRQIDALSSEARRGVVEQVKEAQPDPADDPDADGHDDESGGARGT